jgi:hypothetical protein
MSNLVQFNWKLVSGSSASIILADVVCLSDNLSLVAGGRALAAARGAVGSPSLRPVPPRHPSQVQPRFALHLLPHLFFFSFFCMLQKKKHQLNNGSSELRPYDIHCDTIDLTYVMVGKSTLARRVDEAIMEFEKVITGAPGQEANLVLSFMTKRVSRTLGWRKEDKYPWEKHVFSCRLKPATVGDGISPPRKEKKRKKKRKKKEKRAKWRKEKGEEKKGMVGGGVDQEC